MDKSILNVIEGMRLRKTLKVYEQRYIKDTLTMYNWDKRHTAKVLGIGLSSLYRKIKEHKIKR